MILLQKQKYSGGHKENGLLETSGKRLAEGLGIKIYTPRIVPKKRGRVLNWGVPVVPTWSSESTTFYNHPYSVRNSSNKRTSFRIFEEYGVGCVTWTLNKEEALSWIFEDKRVICRTSLTGCSGEGIVIANTPEELVDAPLYTLYFPKKWEFRVHVINGEVVLIQQKRGLSTEELEKRGIVDRCKYIRNLANGYIFSTNLDPLSHSIYSVMGDECLQAVQSLGLFFGAVDVVISKEEEIRVLEVNSAPGLEGKTLETYISKFKEIINE